jgi:hypothetical protein
VLRIALSAAFAALMVLVASGAAPAASPSPSPSASAQATAAPTAAATPVATPSPQTTSEPPRTIIYLDASRLDFFYNRFLIEGDGNVRVRTSDGFTVTGDAFSMDLKLNRFMVAGHVTLHDASGTVKGAAISDFLDFRRIYFVPVTTQPDRWTFLDGDLAHPAKGRVMPGDAFYFPSIGEHPSITGTGAVIDTKTYVRFINAHTYFLDAGVPLGSYVVNFSSNQYFAQNTLSGASVDLTWTLAGSPNALTALHLRYDPTYKTYLSVEQHFVGDHEYAIFSVNPATRDEKWWNLALYEKLGSRFQIQSFTQYYAQQDWLREPQAAQQTTYLSATYAFPHSYVQATSQLTNYNVLGPGSLGPGTVAGSLDHPSQVQITATSFQNKIADLPIFEQIYEGYGFNHDTVGGLQYRQGSNGIPPIPVPGLQAYGSPCADQHGAKNPPVYFCPVYTTIWNTVFGFNLYTPSLKLNNPANPYETYYFNASYNKQYQWNSLPHWISTASENFSINRQFSRAVNTYVGYQILNVGDHYINGGYLPCEPVGTSFCPLSFTSFRGVSTLRTTSFGLNLVPNPDFNFSLLVRHHVDYPIPVPNLFGLPPNNILGQPLYTSYLGQAPYDATGDVRFKLLPHALLDVSRTFYWYGGAHGDEFWQPSFVIQLLPI